MSKYFYFAPGQRVLVKFNRETVRMHNFFWTTQYIHENLFCPWMTLMWWQAKKKWNYSIQKKWRECVVWRNNTTPLTCTRVMPVRDDTKRKNISISTSQQCCEKKYFSAIIVRRYFSENITLPGIWANIAQFHDRTKKRPKPRSRKKIRLIQWSSIARIVVS